MFNNRLYKKVWSDKNMSGPTKSRILVRPMSDKILKYFDSTVMHSNSKFQVIIYPPMQYHLYMNIHVPTLMLCSVALTLDGVQFSLQGLGHVLSSFTFRSRRCGEGNFSPFLHVRQNVVYHISRVDIQNIAYLYIILRYILVKLL